MVRKYTEAALDIVNSLCDKGFVEISSPEQKDEWLIRAEALVCAYHGEPYQLDNSVNNRMLHVFESYNKDNNEMWTIIAYLLYNNIGDEYALSVYADDCRDDSGFVNMGELLKSKLTGGSR